MRSIKILALCALLVTSMQSAVFAADLTPSAAASTTVDLRFGEFFKLPVGPKGLEPSPKLLGLDGKTVQMVGYMVRQDGDTAVPGLFVLAPLPVTLGDEDESFADDLPASVIYVHLPAAQNTDHIAHKNGLLSVRGVLELGPQAEPDGRISFVRLRLDGEPLGVNGGRLSASSSY